MKPLLKYDSFKVRIPKELINQKDLENLSIDKQINAVVLNDEIIELNQLQNYGFRITENGKIKQVKLSNDSHITSIAVALEKQYNVIEKIDYVTLKVTSKLLKDSYYLGINFATLPKIVEYLNSVGISVSESILLESEITDIDICKDVILNDTEYNGIIEKVISNTKESKQYSKGYNLFNQKENKGIEFSKRTTATPTNPYLKLYNKSLDSISVKHGTFFQRYNITTPAGLHRIEATLKNKKHFEKYKLGNTLSDFLNLNQDELTMIMNDITSIHLEKNPYIDLEPRTNTDTVKLYQELCLLYGTELAIPTLSIIEAVVKHIPNRTTRNNHEIKFKETANTLLREKETFKEKSDLNEKLSELFFIWVSTL